MNNLKQADVLVNVNPIMQRDISTIFNNQFKMLTDMLQKIRILNGIFPYSLKHRMGNIINDERVIEVLFNPRQDFEKIFHELNIIQKVLSENKALYLDKKNFFTEGFYKIDAIITELKAELMEEKAKQAINTYNREKTEANLKKLKNAENAAKTLMKPLDNVIKTVASALTHGTIPMGSEEVISAESIINATSALPKMYLSNKLAQQNLDSICTQLSEENTIRRIKYHEGLTEKIKALYEQKIWMNSTIHIIEILASDFQVICDLIPDKINTLKNSLDHTKASDHPNNKLITDKIADLEKLYPDILNLKNNYVQQVNLVSMQLKNEEKRHNEVLATEILKVKSQTKEIDAMQHGVTVFLRRKRKDLSTSSDTTKSGYHVALNHSGMFGTAEKKTKKALVQLHVLYKLKREPPFYGQSWNPFNYKGNTPNCVMRKFNRMEDLVCKVMKKLPRNSTHEIKSHTYIAALFNVVIAKMKENSGIPIAKLLRKTDIKDFLNAWAKYAFLSYNAGYKIEHQRHIDANVYQSVYLQLTSLPEADYLSFCIESTKSSNVQPAATTLAKLCDKLPIYDQKQDVLALRS